MHQSPPHHPVPYRKIQIILTAMAVVANSVYNGSWQSLASLLYDIPASIATFMFIAQMLLETCEKGITPKTLIRTATIIAMFTVTAGRDFAHWSISGHLSCVLTVATIQLFDQNITKAGRCLFWLPIPIVLSYRWINGDMTSSGVINHWQTYNAFIFAAITSSLAITLERATPPKKPSSPDYTATAKD